MKPWMKIMMWIGLGGGIGFFAGYQIGTKGKREAYDEGREDGYSEYKDEHNRYIWDFDRAAKEVLAEYAGKDTDGDAVDICQDDEDAEMPEEEPEIGDEAEIEEIPELHAQHMIPERISEEEYYENPWNYEQESLTYFEEDKVLYNNDTRAAIHDSDGQDQVIGIGMLLNFRQKDGEVLDAIFVRNDTMGVIFRIDRVEAAYDDEMSGADSPEYEKEDLD